MYKKTLCLGGSFNPIHLGHLICARSVAEKAGFGRVLLIPSAMPPHKPNHPELADAAHRLQMCRLAIAQPLAPSPRRGAQTLIEFDVSDIEIHRSGPSYTIDTVREFKKSGWPQVNWLIGADMLNYLPNWHQAAALAEEATFIIMARPGIPIHWNSLPATFSILKNNVIEAPLIEISSTMIRQRIRDGLSIDYLTPPPVVDYILSNGLYRT